MKLRPSFFLIFALSIVATSAAVHSMALFWNTTGCDFRGLQPGEYLGACGQKIFADYEHNALYYGLEPPSAAAMAAADVLFFGSSRTQAGFHQGVVGEAAASIGAKHFMLGFGFDEKMPFPKALIESYNLRPRVAVVNVDPFFIDRLSAASRPILEGQAEHRLSAIFRRTHARMKQAACRNGWFSENTCGGSKLTVYRSRMTGGWRVLHWLDQAIPVPPEDPAEPDPANVARLGSAARAFAEQLHLDPACLILTAVPSEVSSRTLAARVATSAGGRAVAPDVSGLKTYEGSHLQIDSAARWTAAFMAEAMPIVAGCVHKQRAP